MDNNINNNNLILYNYFEVKRKKAIISIRLILSNEFDNTFNYISRMESVKDKNRATILFIHELSNACFDICIFNTPEVIEHLNKSLLTEKETRWIIPNAELEKVITNIEENKNFKFDSVMTLLTIEQYLYGKLKKAMIEKFRLRFKLSSEQSYYDFVIKDLKNTDRRLNKKGVFDTIWLKLKKITKPILFNLYDAPKEFLTHLQNINSKESDKIMLQIYHQYLTAINMNEKVNTKLRLLYPLYALVLKERKWEVNRFMFGKKIGQLDNREIDKIMWKFIFKR